jgi:hypothetical protein
LAQKRGKVARRLWANDLADFFARVYATLVTPISVAYVLGLKADEFEAALEVYRSHLAAFTATRRTTSRRLSAVRLLVTMNIGEEPPVTPLRAVDELLAEDGTYTLRWPQLAVRESGHRANC